MILRPKTDLIEKGKTNIGTEETESQERNFLMI